MFKLSETNKSARFGRFGLGKCDETSQTSGF